jgi:hypothetical protein
MTLKEFRAHVLATQEMGLCLLRKWWRPLTCAGIAGSLLVNGIWVPLITRTGADLTGLAALVAALTPFVAARTFEKLKGAE